MRYRGTSYWTESADLELKELLVREAIILGFALTIDFEDSDAGLCQLKTTESTGSTFHCECLWDFAPNDVHTCSLEKFEGVAGKLILFGDWRWPSHKQQGRWWIHLEPVESSTTNS